MERIILNKDWIPAYYCKIHHCYDCQICKEIEGYETPAMKDDRLILTTKQTLKYYTNRIKELEKGV